MSLKVKAFRSFFWASFSNIGLKLISPLATFVLAGLLTPTDFGLVAIANLILATIQAIQDFGLSQALIRWTDKTTLQKAADTTFLLVMVWSSLLYGAVVLSAPLTARFFNEPQVAGVIQILGISLLTTAFGSVPNTLLEKQLNFKKKVLPEMLPVTVYIAVSISLALAGWGVWSIVYGRVIQSTISSIMMWLVSKWRFGFSFDFGIARTLIGYSRPLLFTSFLTIAFLYVDNTYIGRMLGVNALGYYAFAFNLANLPVTSITFVVNRVSFPSFVELHEQARPLNTAFLYSIRMIVLVILPLILGQIALMPEALYIFYGDKWIPSFLPLQILSVYALFRSIGGLPSAILMTLGQHHIIPKLIALYVIMAMVLLWPATRFGNIVAVSVVMSSILTVGSIIWLVLANHYLSISWTQFVTNILPYTLAALLMFGSVWFISHTLPVNFISLVVSVVIGGVTYLTGVFIFTKGRALQEVKEFFSAVHSG